MSGAAPEGTADAAVLRDARSKCWKVCRVLCSSCFFVLSARVCAALTGTRRLQARDAFFACADASGERACWRTRRAFTAACPAAWVRHFDKKREERGRVADALKLQQQPRYTGPPPAEAAPRAKGST